MRYASYIAKIRAANYPSTKQPWLGSQAVAVRKIGINSRSMTGRQGASGQQYESSLERDLLDLLSFDLNVCSLEAQPLTIHYAGPDGGLRPYTPDLLVRYRRDVIPAVESPDLLVEVKFRDEYRERFHELKRRFRAARQYAREQGWRFCVLTEREIRTPYLENARFLRPYRNNPNDSECERALLDQIAVRGETAPADLLQSFSDDLDRARHLSALWKLIAEFRIGIDLQQPITMRSRLWALPGDQHQ